MSQASASLRGRSFGPESKSSVRLGVFLRRLREGYGYTLRKVEERAVAYGEVIDNSQLSRFDRSASHDGSNCAKRALPDAIQIGRRADKERG